MTNARLQNYFDNCRKIDEPKNLVPFHTNLSTRPIHSAVNQNDHVLRSTFCPDWSVVFESARAKVNDTWHVVTKCVASHNGTYRL